MKKNLLMLASVAISANMFAAGYILPNGTILYDGSQDPTVYQIEKMSPQNQTATKNPTQVENFAPVQTSSIVVENRTVIYEKPVYIRERYIETRPVYDVVDAVGTVLIFGLVYDAVRHGFYHHELHRGIKPSRYHR